MSQIELTGPPKRRYTKWVVGLLVLIFAALFLLRSRGGEQVPVVRPHWSTVSETIATSGSVDGHAESILGADSPGTVTGLLVDENEFVPKGKLLAIVQPRSAQSQVDQAAAAVARAEAMVRQAKEGPLPAEIRSAQAKIEESAAALGRANVAADRAAIAEKQSGVAVRKSGGALARAKADATAAESRCDLAQKNYDRTKTLVDSGALPKSRLDEDASALQVAKSAVLQADQAVELANEDVSQSRLDQQSSSAAVRQAQFDLTAAKAQQDAAVSDLRRLRSLPRPQDVAVAEAQLREAQTGLAAAQRNVGNTEIRAPYDGIVTDILARPGTLATAGVLHIVDSNNLEVKADVDESNLPSMHTGERVLLEPSNAPSKPIEGKLIRLSSKVDAAKGTVQAVAIPNDRRTPLRPGQRVDLVIVINANAKRLMVPVSAIRRRADITSVLVVRNGIAKEVSVEVGMTANNEIAVTSGLTENDQVIRTPAALEDGARVKPIQ